MNGEASRQVWPAKACFAGIMLAELAMGVLAGVYLVGGDETRHFTTIWFFTCMGIAAGLVVIGQGWTDKWLQAGPGRWETLWLVAFALAGAAFSYWCGMRQFGGYDHSVVIDTGWRLYSGQVPYVDFPCTIPVGFYLGAEAAFRMFGVFWSSIVKLNVLYFILTYFWAYAILRQLFADRYVALLIVVACESMSLILDSYWWYNPITSMAVVVYGSSTAAVMLRPGSPWRWGSFCLALLLAALMKPNISGAAILGGGIALLMDRRTAWRSLLASFIAFMAWLALVNIHGSSVAQVLRSYLSVGSRTFEQRIFLQDTTLQEQCFAWLCLAAVIAGFIMLRWQNVDWSRRAKLMVLGGFTIAGSLAGFYGDGEPKVVDLVPALLMVALLMGQPDKEGEMLSLPAVCFRYLIVLCLAFTFSSLDQAAIRNRIRTIGPGTFFEYKMVPQPFDKGFFKGLTAGKNLHMTVDAISGLLRSSRKANPYFGPRLQWAYAAFGIPSPRQLPIWWHPGVSFPKKDEAMYTQRWIDSHFDPLVVLDVIYMNADVVNTISKSYVIAAFKPLTRESGPLVIMKRKR